MRGMVVLSVLVMVMLVSHTATANPNTAFQLEKAFLSPFMNNTNTNRALMTLMNTNIDLSLKQLLTSKQYGGQDVQRPGMAKLLAEESNRHWEDGISALKMHLQIGGSINATFSPSFTFKGQSELVGVTFSTITQEYRNTLLTLVRTSRNMVKTLTDYHQSAIQNAISYGDLSVAHFLSELAEKEAEVAHKMAMGYTTHMSIRESGMALEMFDDNL